MYIYNEQFIAYEYEPISIFIPMIIRVMAFATEVLCC